MADHFMHYIQPTNMTMCIILPVQVFRQQKTQPLLIQHSRPLRNSQEPKITKKKSILMMAFLENPLFVLFPAQILDLADPGACYEYFFYWHFHNASKEYFWSKKISNFMHRFKSAILEKLKKLKRIYAGKRSKRGFSKKAKGWVATVFWVARTHLARPDLGAHAHVCARPI